MSDTPTRIGGGRRFPETHWSVLIVLGDRSDPRHAEHLDALLRRYWKPIYSYVRYVHPSNRQDAEDLTQGFFLMLLSRVDFAELSPDRGSFRGFLKTALRRFIASAERTRDARSRREQAPLFPFDEVEALSGSHRAASPEEEFDRVWAQGIYNEMLARLEQELTAIGRRHYFEIFRQYCVEPTPDVSYDSLAKQHGVKADDVRNYLRVVRIRGREIVKQLLQDYVFRGEDIDDELRFMFTR